MKTALKLLNPKAIAILVGMALVECIGLHFAGKWLGEQTVDFVDGRWGLMKKIEEEEVS